MRPNSSVCALVAAILVAGAATTSRAGALAEPTLTLSESSVVAGEDIVVSGAGWPFPEDVRLQLEESQSATPHGGPVASAVLADGTFSDATVPVPPDTPPGPYRLVACQACDDVDPGAPFAERELTVRALTPTLRLDPASAAAGEQIAASGDAWDPDGGPVFLFAAESAECTTASALASGQPSAFAITATVPADDPGEYRFMAAQCIGSKVVSRAFASFTITPIEPTTTSSSPSSTSSDPVSPASNGESTGAQPPQALSGERREWLGWLVLAVIVAAVLGALAFRLASRRPDHGRQPPQVSARVAYRPTLPPTVRETTPADRHDVRLLTDEQSGPAISTEERR